nr:hypothetical protein [Geobacillus proteiniphilus]
MPQDWLYGSKSYDTLGVSEPAGVASRLAIYGASLLMMFGFLSLIPSRRFSFSMLGARTFYRKSRLKAHGFNRGMKDGVAW